MLLLLLRSSILLLLLLLLCPTPRINSCREQSRGLDLSAALARVALPELVHEGDFGGDNEEFGRYKVEFGREREEAGVEGRLGLGLLEGLAVVEVGVRKDAPEAPGERGEVAVG